MSYQLHSAIVNHIRGWGSFADLWFAEQDTGVRAIFAQDPVPGAFLKTLLTTDDPLPTTGPGFGVVGPVMDERWMEQKNPDVFTGTLQGMECEVHTQVRFFAPKRLASQRFVKGLSDSLVALLHKKPTELVWEHSMAASVIDVAGSMEINTEHLWGSQTSVRCIQYRTA